VKDAPKPEVLTVLYDGGCPLCRREIAHVQGLAAQQSDSALCFVDVSAAQGTMPAAEQAVLLARFHVQRADGSRLDGAAAFVAMWGRLPALELACRAFLRVRPRLQALARQAERAA
jgi:predicted DCC family thiol-disulfide oxidoreductase YuxK